MEEVKDVTLHVYKIVSQDNNSFVSRFLPAIGFGAYHTCLEVDGYRYTFAASVGVQKARISSSSNSAATTLNITADGEGRGGGAAEWEESIPLGGVEFNRGEINTILKKLEELYFGPTSYHLVYRNCNHFSETFATALIMPEKLIENNHHQQLKTYPSHINRLANTSRSIVKIIDNKDDIIPCNVWEEARFVIVGRDDEKISWSISSRLSAKKNQTTKKKNVQKKKELTEKQKAILAKIRSGKK